MCCQVEVTGTGRFLKQKIPAECDVSECQLETSKMRRPGRNRAAEPWDKNFNSIHGTGAKVV